MQISRFYLGAAFLLIPTAAIAQDAEGAESASGQAVGKAGLELDEIVVTAQRRSENLQKVPIAITTVTEDQLAAQSISSTADLTSVLPGLKQGYSAGTSVVYVRGIGQSTGAPGVVSPVATYLDGVYLGVARLSLFDLNAVSQVSLLRGPQGSLFGRNASGGVIQVATKDPEFTAKGQATIGYANYNTVRGDFYATGPLSDNVAMNLSLKGRKQADGAITNTFTGNDLLKQQVYSAQSKLLWRPGPDTEMILSGTYFYSKDLPGAVTGWSPGYIASDGLTTYLGENKVSSRIDPENDIDTKITSLKIQHDLSGVTIENIAHGLWTDFHFLAQQGGHAGRPNPNNAASLYSLNDSTIFAWGDDLQISSNTKGAPFNWIAGISYENELTKSRFAPQLDGVRILDIESRYMSKAWAAFVQGTYAIVPGTRVTVGGRYTTDKVSFFGRNYVNGQTSVTAGLPPSSTFNQITWRGSLDQDISPDVMVFASVNRGFKAGQYNVTSVANPPIKPEITDAYEIGMKGEFLDRRLRINASAFLQDTKNLQLRATINGLPILFNAATSQTIGLDLDANALIADGLTLTGGFEWLPRAKYTSFPNASAVLPTPLLTIPSNCTGATNPRIGGTTSVVCDLTGFRMIYSAKFSGTLGVRYVKRTPGGEFSFNASEQYSSRYTVDPNFSTSVKPYHLVNASAMWTDPSDKFSMKLWVTNLAKASIYTNSQFIYVPGEPRRFGLDLGMKF